MAKSAAQLLYGPVFVTCLVVEVRCVDIAAGIVLGWDNVIFIGKPLDGNVAGAKVNVLHCLAQIKASLIIPNCKALIPKQSIKKKYILGKCIFYLKKTGSRLLVFFLAGVSFFVCFG